MTSAFVDHQPDGTFCTQFTPLRALPDGRQLIGFVTADQRLISVDDVYRELRKSFDVAAPERRFGHCCTEPVLLTSAKQLCTQQQQDKAHVLGQMQQARQDAAITAGAVSRIKLLVSVSVPAHLFSAMCCPLVGMRIRVHERGSRLPGVMLASGVRCSAFATESPGALLMTHGESSRCTWQHGLQQRHCVESLPISQSCAFELECVQVLPFPALPGVEANQVTCVAVREQTSMTVPLQAQQNTKATAKSAGWQWLPLTQLTPRHVGVLRAAPIISQQFVWGSSIAKQNRCIRYAAVDNRESFERWLVAQCNRKAWNLVRQYWHIDCDWFDGVGARLRLVDDLRPRLSSAQQELGVQLFDSGKSKLSQASCVYAGAFDARFWWLALALSFDVAFELFADDVHNAAFELLTGASPLAILFDARFKIGRQLLRNVALKDSVTRLVDCARRRTDLFAWPHTVDLDLRSLIHDAVLIHQRLLHMDAKTAVVCDRLVRQQDLPLFDSLPLCVIPLVIDGDRTRVAFALATSCVSQFVQQ